MEMVQELSISYDGNHYFSYEDRAAQTHFQTDRRTLYRLCPCNRVFVSVPTETAEKLTDLR